MDFFDKLTEKITNTSKDVANKAKELADLAGLNSKIASQESLIDKYFKEIGRFMYEHKDEPCDNGLEERYKLVDSALEEIARLKKEIRKIKKIKECENCGAEVPQDAVFCCKCGTAVPEDVPEEVHAEEVRDVTDEVVTEETAASEETADAELGE